MRMAEMLKEVRSVFDTSRRERLRDAQGDGREHPDPTPHHLALDDERPPTLAELVQRYVRDEVSQQAQADGFETWEEADDFTEDDPEELPFTPYVLSEHQLEDELPHPADYHPGEPPSDEVAPDTEPREVPPETEATMSDDPQ